MTGAIALNSGLVAVFAARGFLRRPLTMGEGLSIYGVLSIAWVMFS